MEGKPYRVLETTSLAEVHEKYRGQIGTCVETYDGVSIIKLKFDDGYPLLFSLDEVEEVKS